MALITMSRKELGRLEVLVDLDAGRTTAARAATLLGVGERQVFRLLKAYRTRGAAGLVSRRRGRPSNRRYPEAVRAGAVRTSGERYAHCGATLAAEKLAEAHDLGCGRKTVRRWMAAAGLWVPYKERAPRVHQPSTVATAWRSWSSSTGASTPGSRIAARPAPCWCSWMTPPAG